MRDEVYPADRNLTRAIYTTTGGKCLPLRCVRFVIGHARWNLEQNVPPRTLACGGMCRRRSTPARCRSTACSSCRTFGNCRARRRSSLGIGRRACRGVSAGCPAANASTPAGKGLAPFSVINDRKTSRSPARERLHIAGRLVGGAHPTHFQALSATDTIYSLLASIAAPSLRLPRQAWTSASSE